MNVKTTFATSRQPGSLEDLSTHWYSSLLSTAGQETESLAQEDRLAGWLGMET